MQQINNCSYEEGDFRLDPQYKRMRRKIKKQESIITIQKYVIMICLVCIGLFGISNMASIRSNTVMEEYVSSVESRYTALRTEYENLALQFDDVSNILKNISEVAVDLDTENKKLKSTIDKQYETIQVYEEREELFDKYEYAIIRRENGTRTDITYDNIRTLENLTQEKGLNEETVDLVLSLAMVESGGTEKALNKSSSARGYGQLLSSTGKFVYTKLMGNDSYTHDMALDGETNLTMTLELVDYLDGKYDGNWNYAINSYRGIYDESYRRKINTYLSYSDLSLAQLNLRD